MRQNFTAGVEVLAADLVGISQAIERNLFERTLFELMGQPAATVCFGQALRVSYQSATTVQVAPGNGVHFDPAQLPPEPVRRPFNLAAPLTLTLAAADPANPRVDLVVARALLVTDQSLTRRFKDSSTNVVSQQTIVTRQNWAADVQVIKGTPAASPVAPALPQGFALVATITVPASTGLTAQANIIDQRQFAVRGRFAVAFNQTSGLAPVQNEEFGDQVSLFELGQSQVLTATIKVPFNYVKGSRISLSLNAYSPSAAGVWNMQTVSTLIRAGIDALGSTTNQRTYLHDQQTNAIANQLRALTFHLTDGQGQINGVAGSPGDAIQVQLSRAAITSGTDDSLEVRVFAGSTEGVY